MIPTAKTMNNQLATQTIQSSTIKTISRVLKPQDIITKQQTIQTTSRITLTITTTILLRQQIKTQASNNKQTTKLQINNLTRLSMRSICRARKSRPTQRLTPNRTIQRPIYKDFEQQILLSVCFYSLMKMTIADETSRLR